MAIFNINDKVKVIGASSHSDYQQEYLGKIGVIQELDDVPYVLFDSGEMVCFLEEWLELIK